MVTPALETVATIEKFIELYSAMNKNLFRPLHTVAPTNNADHLHVKGRWYVKHPVWLPYSLKWERYGKLVLDPAPRHQRFNEKRNSETNRFQTSAASLIGALPISPEIVLSAELIVSMVVRAAVNLSLHNSVWKLW